MTNDLVIISLLAIIMFFLFSAAITSFLENEKRAGWLLTAISLLTSIILWSILNYSAEGDVVRWMLVGMFGSILLIFFLPIKPLRNPELRNPESRYHEIDSVLSRRLLEPGTKRYNEYYKKWPQRKIEDDRARKNPGLLSEEANFYEARSFAAAKANFSVSDHLHLLKNQHTEKKDAIIDESSETRFIKAWLLRTGAHDVSITALKDHHLYTHKGRGPDFGKPIVNGHPHAIVILTEMDHRMMRKAPEGTTVMESSEQYLKSGILASKLAKYIQHRGYSAKAHTDGNYELICPLVAQDAGLGVVGRMGLLMTPRLGPRVRISVVTTNFPLLADSLKADLSALSFCRKCKKCADVCPVNAIPDGKMKEIDGIKRWQINSEKCYNYWTIAGTDCGKCVISCPYSHPDNWFHRFIRFSIGNNLLFQNVARKLDDVFYGRSGGF